MVKPVPATPASDVPSRVRKGRQVSGVDALGYANSLVHKPANHSGCYIVRCMPCGLPVAYNCNCACGDTICMPQLGCFLLPWPCICVCERDGNAYILRGKGGERAGYIMVVDEDRGTIACYQRRRCFECEGPIGKSPCCYCYRVC